MQNAVVTRFTRVTAKPVHNLTVGSLAWSGEDLPVGVVLPRVVGMMGPKCEGGIGQNVDGHHSDRHHTFYHLLGMLCWLYPVGYPRI